MKSFPRAEPLPPRDLGGTRWFQTLKGNAFHLFDPRPEDFDIEEIAHALALQNRFNGHTSEPYSVAQHSVLVSLLLEEWDEPSQVVFCGLMHDAAEAYIGDCIQPLKRELPSFYEVEERIERALAERFGMPFPFPEAVKRADTTMLLVESRDLLAEPPRPWPTEGIDLPEWGVTCMEWREAHDYFLERFAELEKVMNR